MRVESREGMWKTKCMVVVEFANKYFIYFIFFLNIF